VADSIPPAADQPRLLKRLYRFRRDQAGPQRPLARLLRRHRKAALVAALRRDWRGGYVLTDRGELAFVPAPLEARGEALMFNGFDMPKPVFGHVPKHGVVIDIGANLGEWSVPLAQAVGPGGRVLCCDPNPSVAAALLATLRINNLRQAEVLQIALSDADGDGHLAIDPRDSGQSRLAASGIGVWLRTLDAIVAEAALARIDLIKIDVEGHEAAVLAGAAGALQRFRPAMIFESGHEAAGDRARIGEVLDQAGYAIVAALHHYGALACTTADYRAGTGPAAGGPLNLLALPEPPRR
jgi:FkbM family methyltransferase